jgi:endoglucanase
MKISLSLVASLVAGASAKIYYAGVAESGGEFGAYGVKGTGIPGTFGRDYQFINQAGVDVHVDKNHINLFRVAFLLERMCPPTTGLGAKFNETHFGHFKEAVDYVTVTKGAYAILDPHNYMRYNDPSSQPYSGSVIGNASDPAAATTAQFGAFWGELAGRFKNNEKVIFGLMNEPHDMTTKLVLQNNQAAIDAIRAKGAKNLIIMPGNSWTGGHAWTQGSDPSSALMNQFKDPANNTALDIHEYLDVDFSGGHSACVSDAATYLKDLTAWLKVSTAHPKSSLSIPPPPELDMSIDICILCHENHRYHRFHYPKRLPPTPTSPELAPSLTNPKPQPTGQQAKSLHNRVRRRQQHGLRDAAHQHDQLHGRPRRVPRLDGVGRGALLGAQQPLLHRLGAARQPRARQHRRRRLARPVRHRLAARHPAPRPQEAAVARAGQRARGQADYFSGVELGSGWFLSTVCS